MTRVDSREMTGTAMMSREFRYEEDHIKSTEGIATTHISSNEEAKRQMATELLLQGFSEKAVCRILNISPEQIPETLPF